MTGTAPDHVGDAEAAVGPRVELRNVADRFGDERRRGGAAPVAALGPIDLTIDNGEFVVIVGPSGCGKTTLLSLLAGFLRPSEGEVYVDGEIVRKPSPQRGVVFQQPNLYPWYSVRDNVALGPRLAGVGRTERHEIAERQLALVGLSEFAEAKPYELSGGMQQRAQIARVLAAEPSMLLLDEPFGALDALTRERLQGELRRLWRKDRQTVVFITHGVDEAVFLATRVLVLSPRPGRLLFDERPDLPLDADGNPDRSSPEFAAFAARVRAAITE